MGSYKEKKQYSKIINNQQCAKSSKCFFSIYRIYFKYCIMLKSQKLTNFKKSMTTIITFQIKILPYVGDVGSTCNFLSRNLGHKKLINNKASITIQLFSW